MRPASTSGWSSGTKVRLSVDRHDRRVGQALGEPLGQRDREHAVLRRPGEQHGPVERAELLGCRKRVATMHRAEETGDVRSDRSTVPAGTQEAVDDLVGHRMLGEPAEPDRQPLHPARAERLRQDRCCPRHPSRDREGREQGREEPLERVRRREHDAADALGMPGHEDLGDGAAAVVPDDGHVIQVEVVQELGHEVGHARRCQVGVGDRQLVRPERPVDGDAAQPGFGESGHHVLPEVGVDEQAVDEHHGRPVGGPALEATDGGVGQRDVARRAESRRTGHGRNLHTRRMYV